MFCDGIFFVNFHPIIIDTMESKKSVGALSVLPKFMTLNEKLRLELIDI